MGTTLTGTTPQDTYDSLIKVTNNGPLSSTARYLSDGLGNDSVLALSTSRVGIGTASPDLTLHLYNSAAALAYFESTSVNGPYVIWRNSGTSIGDVGSQLGISGSGSASNFMIASRSGDMILGSSSAERVRITSTGNVGIGTSTPSVKLDVESGIEGITAGFAGATYGVRIDNGGAFSTGASTIHGVNSTLTTSYQPLRLNGSYTALCVDNTEVARATANGLTFNGDTAAANALDDYEEGTWTMGISFGGGSTGITYNANTGTYTKIGRQVTVNGYISLTSKGSSTGNALLTGLPFTIGNSIPNFSVPSLWFNNVSFTNQFQGYANYGTTTVLLQEITTLGSNSSLTNADFANNSEIMVSLTYFV